MNQKVIFNAIDNSVKVRPQISREQVEEIAFKCFGLQAETGSLLKELNSYDDRNYFIRGKLMKRGHEFDQQYEGFDAFVLKIFGKPIQLWQEDINKMMTHCYNECTRHFKTPLPIYGTDNATMLQLYDIPLLDDFQVIGGSLDDILSKSEGMTVKDGVYYVTHMVRLSVFIPGKVVDTVTMSDELAFNYGKSAAIMHLTLKDIEAPKIDYAENSIWNMVNAGKNVYNPYVTSLVDVDRKRRVEKILQDYNNNTFLKFKAIPKQWIHGDLNDQNIIRYVSDESDQSDESNEIAGILDFDTMVYSYRVIDLAICLMYVTGTSTTKRCMELAKQIFQGYTSLIKLTDIELSILYDLMLVRYVQVCCINDYNFKYIDPGNEYILVAAKTAWGILKYIVDLGKDEFLRKIQELN